MKTISLRTVALVAPLLSAFAALYGCGVDDPTVAGTAGTGSGGTSPTGGSSPTAGTAPTAGTTTTGGSSSMAGTTSTTGGTGGGTGGAGGSVAGGTAGTGTGGTGGASGGCTDPKACIDEVANAPSSFGNPGWKDSWWVTGCAEKHDHDCYTIVNGCNANDGAGSEEKGARTMESWTLGGMPGQHYKVTFTYNAINEGKEYAGGKKDQPVAGDVNTRADNDSFYRDGNSPESNYNVIKLSVYDDKGMKQRHYYMNAFSKTQENHYAFSSSYTKSIVVVGGGKIEHFVQDKNCHAIDNCNAGEVVGTTCNSPRRLPGADGQLMLPPMYQDTNDGNKIKATNLISITNSRAQPWKAQASHLTVTAIEKTSDPVNKDY